MTNINSVRPITRLFQLIDGFHISQALFVVAKLGIADFLKNGPKSADELAKDLNVNPDSLYRVLRSLTSLEVFNETTQNKFMLTPISQLLCSDNKDSLLNIVLLNCGEERYQAFGKLLDNVKNGETAFNQVFRMGHFEYLALHENANVIFNKAMVELTHMRVTGSGNSFEEFDFSSSKQICDVGGGKGLLIASLLKKYSHLHGILFDLPEAVTDVPALLSSLNVDDRCKITRGSFFDSVPSGADVYILSRVFHDWSDEKAIKILENCRKVMKRTNVLLILDQILPEGTLPQSVTQLDLMMMAVTGGKERTEKQWKKLLDKGGFKITRTWNTDPNLLEATSKE